MIGSDKVEFREGLQSLPMITRLNKLGNIGVNITPPVSFRNERPSYLKVPVPHLFMQEIKLSGCIKDNDYHLGSLLCSLEEVVIPNQVLLG